MDQNLGVWGGLAVTSFTPVLNQNKYCTFCTYAQVKKCEPPISEIHSKPKLNALGLHTQVIYQSASMTRHEKPKQLTLKLVAVSSLRPWWLRLLHTATINQTIDSTSVIYIPIVTQLRLSISFLSWLVAVTPDNIEVWNMPVTWQGSMTSLFLGVNNKPMAIVILLIIL